MRLLSKNDLMYKMEKDNLLFASLIMLLPCVSWLTTFSEEIALFGGVMTAINNLLIMVQLGFPTGNLGGS